MTREDIHEKIHFGDRLDYRSFNELHETIEEIFDYFEEEEIIRSCSSCKEWIGNNPFKGFRNVTGTTIDLGGCNDYFEEKKK